MIFTPDKNKEKQRSLVDVKKISPDAILIGHFHSFVSFSSSLERFVWFTFWLVWSLISFATLLDASLVEHEVVDCQSLVIIIIVVIEWSSSIPAAILLQLIYFCDESQYKLFILYSNVRETISRKEHLTFVSLVEEILRFFSDFCLRQDNELLTSLFLRTKFKCIRQKFAIFLLQIDNSPFYCSWSPPSAKSPYQPLAKHETRSLHEYRSARTHTHTHEFKASRNKNIKCIRRKNWMAKCLKRWIFISLPFRRRRTFGSNATKNAQRKKKSWKHTKHRVVSNVISAAWKTSRFRQVTKCISWFRASWHRRWRRRRRQLRQRQETKMKRKRKYSKLSNSRWTQYNKWLAIVMTMSAIAFTLSFCFFSFEKNISRQKNGTSHVQLCECARMQDDRMSEFKSVC